MAQWQPRANREYNSLLTHNHYRGTDNHLTHHWCTHMWPLMRIIKSSRRPQQDKRPARQQQGTVPPLKQNINLTRIEAKGGGEKATRANWHGPPPTENTKATRTVIMAMREARFLAHCPHHLAAEGIGNQK